MVRWASREAIQGHREGPVIVALVLTVVLAGCAQVRETPRSSTVNSPFSVGGSRFVTVDLDATARIWRTSSGKLLRTLRTGGVNSAVFSGDGTLVLTGGGSKAQIWDAGSGRLLRTLSGKGVTVDRAMFSPDGRLVITKSGWRDHTARIWATRSGELLQTLRHKDTVHSAAFNKDGSLVVTASYDETAKIWETTSGRLLRTLPHGASVATAAFSPGGDLVVTASDDDTAKVWKTSDGRLLKTLAHPRMVESATFTPDGKRVFTTDGFGNSVRAWDVSSGKLRFVLETHDFVDRVAFSPDGKRLLTSSWLTPDALLWDAAGGRLLHTLHHLSRLPSAGFSPDGGVVLTASEDGNARIWDAATGQLRRTVATTLAAPCAVMTPAARHRRATLSFVRGPDILVAPTHGGQVSTLLPGRGSGNINSQLWYQDPAWSLDGRCLAVSAVHPQDHNPFWFWPTDLLVRRGAHELRVTGGGEGSPGGESWSPDGRRLVVVHYQSVNGGGLYIQGVGSRKEIELTTWAADDWTAPGDATPAWSPDGTLIAFVRTQRAPRLFVIRPDTTGLRRLLAIPAEHPSWSPTGKRLAFDSRGRIAVVDADGHNLRYLTDPTGADSDPAWSPDGRRIAFTRFPTKKADTGDIWLMSPTGADQLLLVEHGSQPAWKPQ